MKVEEKKVEEKKVEEPKFDEIVKDEDLPTLDDILQCFTLEGIFEKEHKALLTGFLTPDSRKLFEELLEKFKDDENSTAFILSTVANLIFEERFTVFKGEWELVQRKLKKKNKSIKGQVNSDAIERVENIAVVEVD